LRARTRSPLRTAVTAAALVGALGASLAPAAGQSAQQVPSRSTAQGAGAPAEPAAVEDAIVAGISEDLSGVRVVGRAAEAAQVAFEETRAALDATIAARIALQEQLFELRVRDAQLTSRIEAETEARKTAAETFVDAREQMQAAAVSTYTAEAQLDEITAVVDFAATVEVGRVATYGETVRDDRLRIAVDATEEYERASRALDGSQLERIDVRERATAVGAELQATTEAEAQLTVELESREAERDRTRATATVQSTDFSLVALDAYWRAAAGEAACGLQWWMLAGISRVEGRHGTYGGTELLADGSNTRRIIGIALTGSGGTAAVGDSDGGALDGDPVHDRAVGPMQFIPSTWRRFARDGNGDGVSDPQNMYDATAAAAAYLCHGRRVDSEAGLRAGYFSYNHSLAYVDTVLGHAYGYREVRIPEPLPELADG
jgi:hypothetical protein